jgi:hypothetical protein
LEDVVAAQAGADGSDPTFTWQTDGTLVVERYLRDSAGWDEAHLMALDNADEIAADVGQIDDPSVLGSTGPVGSVRVFATACAPAPGQHCSAGYITVARLLRDRDAGVWVVIAFEPTGVAYPEVLPTRD